MTNLEGRVLLRERTVEPPPGARSDLWILCELARRLGAGAHLRRPSRPRCSTSCAERVRARADYSGITYDRLRAGERLYWPVPALEHPGTPALFEERFPTADGRARFVAAVPEADLERPDGRYPWTFTTGRVREHYNSGAQTRRVPRLAAAVGGAVAQIHPGLAARFGIADGAMMRITSRRGSIELPAAHSTAIRPEVIFAAFHWSGNSAVNDLIGGRLDPHSRMPPFKSCAVSIEAIPTNGDDTTPKTLQMSDAALG